MIRDRVLLVTDSCVLQITDSSALLLSGNICPYLLNIDKYCNFIYRKKNKMNISFTKTQEEYISKQVKSGEYQNNSEVIRDALRLHQIYREKVIADLRAEIEKGWNGPDSDISVDDIIASRKQMQ